jgi:hypothetical protein
MGGTTGQEQEHDQVWRSLADGLRTADGPAAESRFGKRRWLGQRSRLIRRGCVRPPRLVRCPAGSPSRFCRTATAAQRPAALAEVFFTSRVRAPRSPLSSARLLPVYSHISVRVTHSPARRAQSSSGPRTPTLVHTDANVLNSPMDSGMAGYSCPASRTFPRGTTAVGTASNWLTVTRVSVSVRNAWKHTSVMSKPISRSHTAVAVTTGGNDDARRTIRG